MLSLNDQTLKSRLHRGRMLLRQRLEDFADGRHASPSRQKLLTRQLFHDA